MNRSSMSKETLVRIGLALLVGSLIIWWMWPYYSGVRLINPVLLNLGGWQIHWYGLLMAVAVIVGWQMLVRDSRKEAWTDRIIDIVIWAVVGGLIGARLLFVLLKWGDFSGHWTEIFYLAQGGLSIHGAVLGGAIATGLYCRQVKLSTLQIWDKLVPPLIIGQIIGRFGNFFNQEAFGGPTVVPWKMWVAPAFRPLGWEQYNWFHPTFLYEAIGLGVLFWLIRYLSRRSWPAGMVTLLYLIGYAVLRFGIEFYRIDSDKWGSLTIAQWASLCIIMAGGVIGLILRYKQSKL
ncbi:MAG: prolipoprotein diacylglyceryl transferase [Patescibacteria group bacterium]